MASSAPQLRGALLRPQDQPIEPRLVVFGVRKGSSTRLPQCIKTRKTSFVADQDINQSLFEVLVQHVNGSICHKGLPKLNGVRLGSSDSTVAFISISKLPHLLQGSILQSVPMNPIKIA